MDSSDLQRRIEELETAIRAHRDQRGDDRCWEDDETLYKTLPEGYTPPARDTAVCLENCQHYIASRCHPQTQYVSPQRRIEELEAQLPEEMKNCTIQYRSCPVGHGWLTATNWLEHPCPTCIQQRLEEENHRLKGERNGLRELVAAYHCVALHNSHVSAGATGPGPHEIYYVVLDVDGDISTERYADPDEAALQYYIKYKGALPIGISNWFWNGDTWVAPNARMYAEQEGLDPKELPQQWDLLPEQLREDWNTGGPYPVVSVIVCIDPGNPSGPDPEEAIWAPVCKIADAPANGSKPAFVSLVLAGYIVALHNQYRRDRQVTTPAPALPRDRDYFTPGPGVNERGNYDPDLDN